VKAKRRLYIKFAITLIILTNFTVVVNANTAYYSKVNYKYCLLDIFKIFFERARTISGYQQQIVIFVAVGAMFSAIISQLYINHLQKKIQNANVELYKQHGWLKVTLSSIGDGVIATDENGNINLINQAAQKYTGYEETESIGEKVNSILMIVNEYTKRPEQISIENIVSNKDFNGINKNALLISKDGEEYPISMTIEPIKTSQEKNSGIVIAFQDITRRKLAEKRLTESYQELEKTHNMLSATEEELRNQFELLQENREALKLSEERYRLATEGSTDGIWDWNLETNEMYFSLRWKEILGYEDDEIDNNISSIKKLLHPDDVEEFERVLSDYYNKKIDKYRHEHRLKTKSGEYKWLVGRGQAIWDKNDKPIRMSGAHTDITERKKAEKKIYEMAYYDVLTGLPNRRLFREKLDEAILKTSANNEMLCVVFLDLDNFKTINDTLGHEYGDLLLKKVAQLLISCLKCNENSSKCMDMATRFGGDEFILLRSGIKKHEEIIDLAESIVNEFQKPWIINGREFYITSSIGIAVYPYDGQNAEILIRNADMAMYRAKELSKNNFQFFVKDINTKIVEKLNMEVMLRHAIELNEFEVYYQAQVDIRNNEIVGMEALIRWIQPNRIIPPSEFIPIAEETGFITTIGEWVLRTACKQNKLWQQLGLKKMYVAVNVSPKQFLKHNLVQLVRDVLDETGLEAKWLELEITESIAVQDLEYTINILEKLKNMGVTISLDDFGTGYSSLNYLKNLPINTLKIDRSFVHDITVNLNEKFIAETVINLAHNMNLCVVAEGVETTEQLRLLKTQNCDKVQGYLFSKPLAKNEFEALMAKEDRTGT
jgi:diguanylate cyclase (GGDEF)-like protein/PAS domain S-box-containing protein